MHGLKHQRRTFLRTIFGAAFSSWASRAAETGRRVFEVELLAKSTPVGECRSWTRTYRANARVLVFGVPLITKSGVGGAVAMIEDSKRDDSRLTALQFNAGSWPEKLGGFNRFGLIKEVVKQSDQGFVEGAFLGLMTSAAEKSVSEAKRSWSEKSPMTISATHGKAGPSGVASVVERFPLRNRYTWSNVSGLMEDFRSLPEQGGSAQPAAPAPPFLFALRRAMQGKSGQGNDRIFHAGKTYTLRTQKAVADKHWPAGTTQLNGWIRSPEGHESAFKVWFDPAEEAGLPIAFEFKPKSFLELTFERTEAVAGVSMSRLLTGESA